MNNEDKICRPKGNKRAIFPHFARAIFVFLSMSLMSCWGQSPKPSKPELVKGPVVHTGSERMEVYLPLLQNKYVALVANQTSLIGKMHLVDTLRSKGIKIIKVFSPEHGFRGQSDAGEHVASGVDEKTGIPLVSLHGDHIKPTADQMKDVDVVLFDIQDVGVRFYTYITTMSYVMEAAAEKNIPMIILDRPNPNGHYIDGPVLEPSFSSFLGLHAVPLVHGMTVGEYAMMVNGEKWLKDGISCDVKVIKCLGWKHSDFYRVKANTSPNLRNMNAIYLYPSLGLFEGTNVSMGRGTDKPFERIGYPGYKNGTYRFTPKSGPGSKHPLFEGKECNGINLEGFGEKVIRDSKKIYLKWLIDFYNASDNKEKFFTKGFDKHAGTDRLRKQIISGESEENIRSSWKPDLEKYKTIRKKYLLYED